MAAKITRDILESYLQCKLKSHLKTTGHHGTRSDYETMLTEAHANVRHDAIDRLLAQHAEQNIAHNMPLTLDLLKQGPLYILDATAEDDNLSLIFDGLKKVPGSSILGDYHYIPILFHKAELDRREHHMLLDVYALVLSHLQAHMPEIGIIWKGSGCKAHKVHLTPELHKGRQLLRDLQAIAYSEAPPKPILNGHCTMCEFRERCHSQARQEDNLSLLRGMSEKEIKRHNKKGIFTVTQLSYTFRPRKKNKKAKKHSHPHIFALHALAIREKKTFVFGTPLLPASHTRIYLDIEGDPERGFVYLVGLLIIDDSGPEKRYAFWADTEAHESRIFHQLLAVLATQEDFTVFHFGSYERSFLRRMRNSSKHKRLVDTILASSTNVLSTIHENIYLPVYSNGLKEVSNYLGFSWSEPTGSGIQSIAWRRRWEVTGDENLKRLLVEYNADDCVALKTVTEHIYALCAKVSQSDPRRPSCDEGLEIVHAQETAGYRSGPKYGRVQFAIPDYEYINQCAYADYQRDKILIRTSPHLKRSMMQSKKKRKKHKINRRITVRCTKCPHCGSAHIRRSGRRPYSGIVYDLRITSSGILRRVVECIGVRYNCEMCDRHFLPKRYKKRDKYLHALKSWALYQHVAHRVSFERIEGMFLEFFDLKVRYREIHIFKALLARYYRMTYRQLMRKILASRYVHIDETEINVKGKGKGYVWVLATAEDVVYIYRPSRDGEFLQAFLAGYKGVVISDYYAAYDSLDCPQQKCLVHLLRDLNDDLRHSPYDEEYRQLASAFGSLLRPIIETIDIHGLKKRWLGKHKIEAARFVRMVDKSTYHSEIAVKYQKRITKNRDKLFVFLDHDGVAWNNNNAEHAVKCFAHYREVADGMLTERGLADYLVLLSIFQTCRYRVMSFLKFLLSRQRDIDSFWENPQRRYNANYVDCYPPGYPRYYKVKKNRPKR